jgi:ferritin-like metal-binding protein YciE
MTPPRSPASQLLLVKYLVEAYGKERQLETALKAQILIAKRPALHTALVDHLKVTQDQIEGLAKRIDALDARASHAADSPLPSIIGGAAKVVATVANKTIAAAKGPIQIFRGTSLADNELRNVRDCYWNEAEEIAHYRVIEAVAQELGDNVTLRLARRYRKQEEEMQTVLETQISALVHEVVEQELTAEGRPASRTTGAASRRAVPAS